MESIYTTFNIITPFWISGVVMAYFLLWRPAIKIISILEPDNIAYKHRFIGFVAFHLMCLIGLPFIIHILLVDEYRERFLRQFIPAYLGKKDE